MPAAASTRACCVPFPPSRRSTSSATRSITYEAVRRRAVAPARRHWRARFARVSRSVRDVAFRSPGLRESTAAIEHVSLVAREPRIDRRSTSANADGASTGPHPRAGDARHARISSTRAPHRSGRASPGVARRLAQRGAQRAARHQLQEPAGLDFDELLAAGLPKQLAVAGLYTGRRTVDRALRARLDALGLKEFSPPP